MVISVDKRNDLIRDHEEKRTDHNKYSEQYRRKKSVRDEASISRASMSLYGLELPSSATSHKVLCSSRMTSRSKLSQVTTRLGIGMVNLIKGFQVREGTGIHRSMQQKAKSRLGEVGHSRA